ncbi:MAG: glycerol kinase GlpK [Pseudomonadota bacterium]
MSFYVLAIDQGTTGSTAIIFDETRASAGKAYREFTQHYPRPGWVEHDAEEIWEVTLGVAREALRSAGVPARSLASIGLTNQRETTVIWDRKTSRPISRAIVWQCRRTSDVIRKLKSRGHEKEVRRRTGLVLDPYFSATKAAWILDHVKGARKRAGRGELAFGTIDSWLIWKLTGGRVHATDPTNAGRTLLFDIRQKAWSDDLLRIFRVPRALLPEVRNSSGDFGTTESALLGAAVPTRGVAGDQQAALFGHYAVSPGRGKCTFGTGAFALAYLGRRPIQSKSGLLTTLVCDADGKPAYGLEGSIFMAGAIVQWLRDGMKWIRNAAESEMEARSVEDTGGVLLVPAFVGLGAPYWDSEARAAVLGMSRGTTRAHIIRAALEAIAYQTSDLVRAMNGDTGHKLNALWVDGGAVRNEFLMQFMADVLGIPVHRPAMIELTAFGAARLAAVSEGLWRTPPEANSRSVTTYHPAISPAERKRKLAAWAEAVSRVRSRA